MNNWWIGFHPHSYLQQAHAYLVISHLGHEKCQEYKELGRHAPMFARMEMVVIFNLLTSLEIALKAYLMQEKIFLLDANNKSSEQKLDELESHLKEYGHDIPRMLNAAKSKGLKLFFQKDAWRDTNVPVLWKKDIETYNECLRILHDVFRNDNNYSIQCLATYCTLYKLSSFRYFDKIAFEHIYPSDIVIFAIKTISAIGALIKPTGKKTLEPIMLPSRNQINFLEKKWLAEVDHHFNELSVKHETQYML